MVCSVACVIMYDINGCIMVMPELDLLRLLYSWRKRISGEHTEHARLCTGGGKKGQSSRGCNGANQSVSMATVLLGC